MNVKLSDGRKLQQHVEHTSGTAERPLTIIRSKVKFRGLCEPYLLQSQITSLIDRCGHITERRDAAILAQLASVT